MTNIYIDADDASAGIPIGGKTATVIAEAGTRPTAAPAPGGELTFRVPQDRPDVDVPASRMTREQAQEAFKKIDAEYAADPTLWHRDPTFALRHATARWIADGHTFAEGQSPVGELDPAGRLVPEGTGAARVELAYNALPAPPPGQSGWDRETHAAFCAFADETQLPHYAIGDGYRVATQALARARSRRAPDDVSWNRPLDEAWGDQADQKLENAAYALEVMLHDDEPRMVRAAQELHALWGWDPAVVRYLADAIYPALVRGNLGPSVVAAIGRRALSLKAATDRARAEAQQIQQREAQERDQALLEAQHRIVEQHDRWGESRSRRR